MHRWGLGGRELGQDRAQVGHQSWEGAGWRAKVAGSGERGGSVVASACAAWRGCGEGETSGVICRYVGSWGMISGLLPRAVCSSPLLWLPAHVTALVFGPVVGLALATGEPRQAGWRARSTGWAAFGPWQMPAWD